MATGPGEMFGENEGRPDPINEIQAEEAQRQPSKERHGGATFLASHAEVMSTLNGIGKGDGNTLHVMDKDLDEFVDSVTEVAPSGLSEKLPEEAKPPIPEKPPLKSPRAEQIAEKVLRAEKLPEKAPRVEKSPVREKTPEPKATRTEKTPKVEKSVRPEKPPEKVRLAPPAAPKPVKRKMDARGKDTVPWEGLTLNKCLLVASFVALLSVGCQVFQEIVEYSESILTAELNAWTSQEGGVGELDERWFFERWLDWSDEEEPLEMEEEEEGEEEEEEVLGMEEEEGEEEEQPASVAKEKEEEEKPAQKEEVPVSKGSPKKSREKAVKRGKVSRGLARRDREPAGKDREEEKDEEEEVKRPHGRQHLRERKSHPQEAKQEDRGRGKRDPHPPKRDPRPRRFELKAPPRPSSSLSKSRGRQD